MRKGVEVRNDMTVECTVSEGDASRVVLLESNLRQEGVLDETKEVFMG